MSVAILVALVGCLSASASPAAPTDGSTAAPRLDTTRYMGVADIKPGMTGIGKTVLKGAELVEFQVTVVDVLKNWGPKQDGILVRCAGANLEHTGIIQGMSGSPVYLRDPKDGNKLKMIGAIAFGWRWHKDPIGGVTPIAEMLGIEGFADSGKGAVRASARSRRFGAASSRRSQVIGNPDPEARSRYAMMGFRAPKYTDSTQPDNRTDRSGDLRPLMTPLLVGGADQATLDYLRGHLGGMRLSPVRAGAGGGGAHPGAPAKLVPGGSLVVPYLIGDVDMAAVGTVTEVIGDRILGFGHAMMAEGPIELPMATGWIHTPIAMMSSSFKLGAMGKLTGSLLGDDEVGIWGDTGRKARMIPVTVTVRGEKETRTYRYQALHHRQITPWVIASGLMMSVQANRSLPEEHTVRHTVSVSYDKLGTFAATNVNSMSQLFGTRSDLSEPMSILMDNRFGQARVKSVDIRVAIEAKATSMNMERIELPQAEFKPGQTVTVAVRWRPYRAKPFVRRYSMTLPDDLPDGTYKLVVGSARSHLSATRSEKPHLFRVESMADMMAAMREIGSVRNDRLYMRLRIPRGGVAVDKVEMPELPSFRRQIIGEPGLRAVEAYSEPIVVEHRVPFVVRGERAFTIEVDRRADQ